MKTEIKERPMLFSAPMVRAILDGSKTQTRRAINPQPVKWCQGLSLPKYSATPLSEFLLGAPIFACPYGKVGDRIWARETFCKVDDSGYGDHAGIWVDYRATPKYKESHPAGWDNDPHNEDALKWKPSIHMPRWASRINLEITAVRVERLNDISEEDAQKEGIKFTDYGLTCFHQGAPQDIGICTAPDSSHQKRPGWHYDKSTHQDQCWHTAKYAFTSLWESINGAGSWEQNPWVWVIEFKLV